MKKTILGLLILVTTACSSAADENLAFNVSGAKGLVLHEVPAESVATNYKSFLQSAFALDETTDTTLGALLENGEVDDEGVVVSGAPQINYFSVIDNTAYLILGDDALVDDVICRFVSVDITTDAVACVDDTINDVVWNSELAREYGPVQIAADGDLYYMFHTEAAEQADETKTVRVLKTDGTKTDVFTAATDDLEPYFILNPDESILVTGEGSENFVKRIDVDGTVTTLSNSSAQFLKTFPDGNIYFGVWGPDDYGIARYLTETGEMDSTKLISMDLNGVEDPRTYECADFDVVDNDFSGAFCGAYSYNFVTTDSEKVFARDTVTGTDTYILMQYYPTVVRPSPSITNVSALAVSGNNLIIAGTDVDTNNKIIIYDTTDDTEETILSEYDLTVGQIIVGSDGSVVIDAYNNDTAEYTTVSFNMTDTSDFTTDTVTGEMINIELFE